MKQAFKSGALIAAAAAAMALSGAVSATPVSAGTGDTVHCAGINSCKGKSDCKSAENACKGQNSCKGKGFVEMTQKQCDAAKAKK